MSLLMKVGIFIGFLVAYVAWVVIVYKLSNRSQTDRLSGRNTFLSDELMLFSSLLGQFAFIWILSGYFSIELVGLFLLLAHVGVVISAILWAFLGSPQVAWGPRAYWAGFEFGITHNIFGVGLMIFSTILIIGYPVAAGIIYFRHVIPSEQATLLILRLTLAGWFLSGIALMLPIIVGMLQSKNLDDDTRARIFIAQGGHLASYALGISLILWSFGDIAGEGYQLTVGVIPLTISPIFLIVMVVFFVLALLLPYLAGSQRAKRWQEQLLRRQQTWFDELLDALEFPAPSLYLSKLEQLKAKVEDDTTQFVESDTGVSLGVEFDQVETLNDVDPTLHNAFLAYKRSRQLDPRLKYLDYLRELDEEIGESITQLTDLTDDAELTKRASVYANAYRARRDDLAKAMEKQRQDRPGVLIGLAFILSPIISQILSEFGKWIWKVFSQTSGP